MISLPSSLPTSVFAPVGSDSSSVALRLLSLLAEDNVDLQLHALTALLPHLDSAWHLVAERLPELEALAEDSSTSASSAAAAVASRVYFHLGEMMSALRLALRGGAGDWEDGGAYGECMRSAAVGLYVARSSGAATEGEVGEEDAGEIEDAALRSLVDGIFRRCYAAGNYEEALGVALEAKDGRRAREALTRGGSRPQVLKYALSHVSSVADKAFRQEVVGLVRDAYAASPPSLEREAALASCALRGGDAGRCAEVVERLLQNTNEEGVLLAYQICLDVVEGGDGGFVARVAKILLDAPKSEEEDAAMTKKRDLVKGILRDGMVVSLHLSFLHKHSNSDRLVMENLRKTLDERSGGGGRSSVLHHCAVVAHAYLNAGTTRDGFLRDNLDWMRRASNWAKFSATASMGVLHAGHTSESMTLLEPYFPSPDAASSTTGGYAEGGSLYALGLIHSPAGCSASPRAAAADFIRTHLRASHANEAISHGAALGAGLCAMGSRDLELVHELKELLYTDSAVAGEAAGIAIGLVLVGTGGTNAEPAVEEVAAELRNYARETQHEKIIRGIATATALMCYGKEGEADAALAELREDRDPILRFGSMYGLGLAYCGTGSEVAVRQLLHAAVSDVNDDVRMAAVISLALVLYRTPRRVPQLVKLLLESFHPHVRYASCIAVGIALAATGDAEALNMLEPMLTDMSDFVRQGGIIATALVLMQQSEANKKTKWFREKLVSIISDKHQSTLTKMGAVMATGILDAGGRNMSISLGSSTTGFTRMTTAVGLVLWLQQWHWYPMMHMFSLALTPTVTIGLNKDFNVPKCFGITCNAKPSLYAYPKKLEEKKEEKKKRIETVALSTTAKSKAREARKKAKDGESSMEIDEEPTPSQEDPEPDAEAAETVEGAEAAAEDRKSRRKDPEPAFHRLANPCRITAPQSAVCAFDLNQRYRPVRPEGRPQGIVMLTDTTPAEEEDVDTMELPSLDDGEGQEVEAPEPFEWAPPEATTEGENTALASEGGGGETKDGEEPSSADSMEVDDKK